MGHILRPYLRFQQADPDTEFALRHRVEHRAPHHTPPQEALRLAQDYAVNLYRWGPSQWGVNTALDAALDYLEAQQVADRRAADC
jgi:hypothetical protein